MRFLTSPRVATFGMTMTLLSALCCSLPRHTLRPTEDVQKTFQGSYDEVWSAILKTLDSFQYKYPSANKDAGFIETDFSKGYSGREFIFSGGEKFPKEIKWKLTLRLLSSTSEEGKPQIRVRIKKEEYVNQGFLEGWKRVESDGVIEKVLLYRIERVIHLNKKIERLTTSFYQPALSALFRL